VLGVKEEEEEELIVAVAVATARIIITCALVLFYRLCRSLRLYIISMYRYPRLDKTIGPLKEREIAILLFGLFSSVRAIIRFRRKEEEEDLYLVRRLSLCVCLFFSVFFFFLPLRVGVSCVFARARFFAAFFLAFGEKCNCGLGFRV
jgi:hypothetical protein